MINIAIDAESSNNDKRRPLRFLRKLAAASTSVPIVYPSQRYATVQKLRPTRLSTANFAVEYRLTPASKLTTVLKVEISVRLSKTVEAPHLESSSVRNVCRAWESPKNGPQFARSEGPNMRDGKGPPP